MFSTLGLLFYSFETGCVNLLFILFTMIKNLLAFD